MLNCRQSRYDGDFLTFALHCRVLIDPLFNHLENLGHAARRKEDESPEQIALFAVPLDKQGQYTKFAKNLAFFLPERVRREVSIGALFQETQGLDFCAYEFYSFFEYANQRLDSDMKSGIAMLEKVGSGVPLDDYCPLINFLSTLESYGLHRHNDLRHRGGCF